MTTKMKMKILMVLVYCLRKFTVAKVLELWKSYTITPLMKTMAHAGNGAAEICGFCEAGLLCCCFSISENWIASRYSVTLSLNIDLDEYASTSIGA